MEQNVEKSKDYLQDEDLNNYKDISFEVSEEEAELFN